MPPRTPLKALERERRDLLAQYVTQGRKFDADAQVKHWMRAQRELMEAENDIAEANTTLAEMGINWLTTYDEEDVGWRNGFTAQSVFQFSNENIGDFIESIRSDFFDGDDSRIRQQSLEQHYDRPEDDVMFMMETLYDSQLALFQNAWKVARAQAKKFVAQTIHSRFTTLIQQGKKFQEDKEARLMGSLMMPTPRRVPMVCGPQPLRRLQPSPDKVDSDHESDDDIDDITSHFKNQTIYE